MNGQPGSFYQNSSNQNAGTLPVARLTGTYNISISGNAATATSATNATNATNVTSGGTVATGTISGSNITGTGWFRGGVGTSAAPTFSFSGDANIGMYRVGADRLAFSVAGGKRMEITAAGQILGGLFSGSGISLASTQFLVVATMPGTPNANTIYFVTT